MKDISTTTPAPEEAANKPSTNGRNGGSRRVVKRTLGRRLRREVLWAGNVEPPLRTFFTDREHIVRWAWSTRHRVRNDVRAQLRGDAWQHYQHSFGSAGGAETDIDFDSDLMRLAAGGR